MVVSILLIAMGIVGLGTLLYRFAVYALPAVIGIWTTSWVFHNGAGIIGAFIIGVLAGGAVFGLAQILYAFVRPLPLRVLLLLIFVLPAAYAGYNIVLQLSELGSLSSFWRELFAMIGAIVVGCSAATQLLGTGKRGNIEGPRTALPERVRRLGAAH